MCADLLYKDRVGHFRLSQIAREGKANAKSILPRKCRCDANIVGVEFVSTATLE